MHYNMRVTAAAEQKFRSYQLPATILLQEAQDAIGSVIFFSINFSIDDFGVYDRLHGANDEIASPLAHQDE